MKKATFVPLKGLTLEDLRENEEVTSYIERANDYLGVLGYTEHGLRHASLVGHISQNILKRLNLPGREPEVAGVAGYLHDIGNVISRDSHGIAGAVIAREILLKYGVSFDEIALVMNAIGNHEEDYGIPTNSVCAAVIIGDKSDVHRSRVRNDEPSSFDIHDRVNYAAERSFIRVDEIDRLITLEIEIDTSISQVMEYFEIFITRMTICRHAAEFLKCKFSLVINGNKLS